MTRIKRIAALGLGAALLVPAGLLSAGPAAAKTNKPAAAKPAASAAKPAASAAKPAATPAKATTPAVIASPKPAAQALDTKKTDQSAFNAKVDTALAAGQITKQEANQLKKDADALSTQKGDMTLKEENLLRDKLAVAIGPTPKPEPGNVGIVLDKFPSPVLQPPAVALPPTLPDTGGGLARPQICPPICGNGDPKPVAPKPIDIAPVKPQPVQPTKPEPAPVVSPAPAALMSTAAPVATPQKNADLCATAFYQPGAAPDTSKKGSGSKPRSPWGNPNSSWNDMDWNLGPFTWNGKDDKDDKKETGRRR